MATLAAMVVCDGAFLDEAEHLYLVGPTSRLEPPRLPAVLEQLMVVGHLREVRAIEEIRVSMIATSPRGFVMAKTGTPNVAVEVIREYVLVTALCVAFREGIYTFTLALAGEQPVSASIPVLTTDLSGKGVQ